jgi:protein-glutamine gamma-glutamyltransferase
VERGGGVRQRLVVAAALASSVGPALLFAPVFGIGALVAPAAVVAVAVYLVAEAALRRPRLVPWRPPAALVLGLLGLVWVLLWHTTAGGVPTGRTVRALAAGVGESWQLTLQSTWPARPDPELLLFVPLAALAAAVVAVELADRSRRPLLAVLPGLALLGLSQAYVSLTGPTAVAVGLGFVAVTGALLVATRRGGDPVPARRAVVTALALVLAVVLAVAGAALGTVVDPAERPAYSLRQNRPAPLPPQRLANPLNEIAERLLDPEAPVFTFTSDGPVDRWRLVVLDTFDGANWKPGGDYRRMGAALTPPPGVTASPRRQHATVQVDDPASPWVPSQPLPAEVTGVAPYVDQTAGTLAVPERTGPLEYGLTWWEPDVDPDALYNAGIDPHADSGFGGLGVVPEGVDELARAAVHDLRPTFRTALLLEDFLSRGYTVARDEDLPTGSGWPALERFLLRDKRGTSEQFAAAYVVLARILGVPARIAVGFRAPAEPGDGPVVVHNEDVLAWPEVAVDGIGWVPLDPSGTARAAGAGSSELAAVTAQARAKLPPPEELVDPDVPEQDRAEPAEASGTGFRVPGPAILVALAAVLLTWLAGVPLAAAVRGHRRRRRPGAGAVVGAWAEARDRLRAHGVPFAPGMTVRDLATAAGPIGGPAVVTGLRTLADRVDEALWSPSGPGPATAAQAWAAVREVRRGLARRPFGTRLRAALSPRSLLPPR